MSVHRTAMEFLTEAKNRVTTQEMRFQRQTQHNTHNHTHTHARGRARDVVSLGQYVPTLGRIAVAPSSGRSSLRRFTFDCCILFTPYDGTYTYRLPICVQVTRFTSESKKLPQLHGDPWDEIWVAHIFCCWCNCCRTSGIHISTWSCVCVCVRACARARARVCLCKAMYDINVDSLLSALKLGLLTAPEYFSGTAKVTTGVT
jgi:hypothetical protein